MLDTITANSACADPCGGWQTQDHPQDPPERHPGILVADDDEQIRLLMSMGLRARGFRVWLAANGPQAVEIYQRHRADIDLALLDIQLPDMDGPQILARLRTINPAVRCCFVSGHPGQYTSEELRELGVARLLAKPFSFAAIAPILWDVAGCAGPA